MAAARLTGRQDFVAVKVDGRNPVLEAPRSSLLTCLARNACFATVLFLGSLAFSRASFPQDTQALAPSPTLKATTDLVLVDVIVKDQKRHHVKNLRQEDFTVLEDGVPQKLASFSLEDAWARPADATKPKPLPKDLYTNRPEYRTPPGPTTVLLLDQLNTPWPDQAYMRVQVLEFLKTYFRPGQRLAILGLGSSLHVLQDFTNAPEILKAAVEGYKPKKSTQLLVADIQSRLPPASRMSSSASADSLAGFYGHEAEVATSNRIGITLEALRSLGRALAGFPGRKILIWFSAGFPLVLPNTGGFESAGFQEGSVPGLSYIGLLQETTQVLTNARVAIYPIDARGLIGAPSVFDASNGGKGPGVAFQGDAFANQITGASIDRNTSQGVMEDIASWTGGTAYMNRNDLDRALEQSIEDGSTYYVLGYYRTDKKQDGKFHKIEVRVDDPNLRIRYRRGYYALKPTGTPLVGDMSVISDVPYADLSTALQADTPLESQILLDARVSQIEISGRPQLFVDLRANPADLSSVRVSDGKRVYSLTLHVAVYNPDGHMLMHKDWGIKSTVRDNSPALENGLPLNVQFPLRPGRYHVRIAVRDSESGRIGTVDAFSIPSSQH